MTRPFCHWFLIQHHNINYFFFWFRLIPPSLTGCPHVQSHTRKTISPLVPERLLLFNPPLDLIYSLVPDVYRPFLVKSTSQVF